MRLEGVGPAGEGAGEQVGVGRSLLPEKQRGAGQRHVDVGGHDELDLGQPRVGPSLQAHEVEQGGGPRGEPSRAAVPRHAQRGQGPRTTVVRRRTAEADDDPPGSGVERDGHQLPDAVGGGAGGIALVGGEQVQAAGEGALDVAGALVEQDGGRDGPGERVLDDGGHLDRPAERGPQGLEHPRSAVGQRTQVEVVERRRPGPADGERLRGLGRREGAAEGVGSEQDAHGKQSARPEVVVRATLSPVDPSARSAA